MRVATAPELPEFDTWHDGAAYCGIHRGTGRFIRAEDAGGFELLAMVERISAAWGA
ncbi:hypothetical protein [Nonomuraea longicatena]|uniref:Uncharacterized protein n=1 Tax=Nonomuraea longicatena TaxID=83682 RepID=A0ABN1NQI5_9ACTN